MEFVHVIVLKDSMIRYLIEPIPNPDFRELLDMPTQFDTGAGLARNDSRVQIDLRDLIVSTVESGAIRLPRAAQDSL